MNDTKKTSAQKKQEAKNLMNSDQWKACHAAIHTATVAAGAGGVIPIPVMDAVPISAAQIAMVIAIGKTFGQKIGESTAKGLISAAASTLVGRSLVKMIPVVGWGVSAAVAAGVTEAIGWTVAVDFAKNSKGSTTSQGQNSSQEQNDARKQDDHQEQDASQKQDVSQEQDISQKQNRSQEQDTSQKQNVSQERDIFQKQDTQSRQTRSEDVDDESIANVFNDEFDEEN